VCHRGLLPPKKRFSKASSNPIQPDLDPSSPRGEGSGHRLVHLYYVTLLILLFLLRLSKATDATFSPAL
jgi:hypothetical protein